MAAIVPFALASLFPIVEALPLERRANSTGSFSTPTKFGPWEVPFWAYILIIVLLIIGAVSLLVWLIKYLISLACCAFCWSLDTLLDNKKEERERQQNYQIQPEYRTELVPMHVYEQPHQRTISFVYGGQPAHIAPYHYPPAAEDQQPKTEQFQLMFIPATPNQNPKSLPASSRPSTEVEHTGPYPPGLPHQYDSRHPS